MRPGPTASPRARASTRRCSTTTSAANVTSTSKWCAIWCARSAAVRAPSRRPGSAEQKLDVWITTIVEEAAARPWFPPIMLRELAAGAPHFDAPTFQMMNDVLLAVKDIIAQGQRDGLFRQVDPLLTHLTILPPILIFFVRQRVIATSKLTKDLAEPRQVDEFTRHMQASAGACSGRTHDCHAPLRVCSAHRCAHHPARSRLRAGDARELAARIRPRGGH